MLYQLCVHLYFRYIEGPLILISRYKPSVSILVKFGCSNPHYHS